MMAFTDTEVCDALIALTARLVLEDMHRCSCILQQGSPYLNCLPFALRSFSPILKALDGRRAEPWWKGARKECLAEPAIGWVASFRKDAGHSHKSIYRRPPKPESEKNGPPESTKHWLETLVLFRYDSVPTFGINNSVSKGLGQGCVGQGSRESQSTLQTRALQNSWGPRYQAVTEVPTIGESGT